MFFTFVAGTPTAAGAGTKFAGTGPADSEIGPDGVNYGLLFETMVRAWAKSRMSSAGSTVTLEAFAVSFARRYRQGRSVCVCVCTCVCGG